MKLTIGKQILLICMVIVVAFMGLSAYTYFQMDKIEAGYDSVLNRSVPLVIEVKELAIELNNQSAQVRGYILSADPQYAQAYDASRQNMNNTLASLEKKLITPEGKQKVGELKTALEEYHQIADQGILVRKSQGQEEALKSVIAAVGKIEAAEKAMNGTVKFLMERMDLRIQENVANINKVHQTQRILTAVIFIFACVAAIFLARRISRPLALVAESAKKIAMGDLRNTTIPYEANDEIGDMITAFKAMKDNLRDVVSQVANSSEQVAAASEELTASSEQSAQASSQVAETVTNVATGASNQVASVEQTVGVVGEMATAISHITSNASNAAAKSGETASAASVGGESVCQARAQMQLIKEAVNQSAQVVQKLGVSSQQIGEFVNLISGIAGQTNLLALNAAIEAARAGEQGRGFAVVADEVRKLAEQSQEAAQKVTVLIHDIQSETNVAVTTMNQGTIEVTRGTEVIATTGEQFNLIVAKIDELNKQVQAITTASKNLSAASEEVVASVDSVRKVAADTAADTQTISAATEEQSASMEEIASSSHALSNMASQLQMIVAKFRL